MDVRAVVTRHNRRALLTGLGLLGLSALLWLITYWAAKVLAYLFFFGFFYDIMALSDEQLLQFSSRVALAILGLLVVECVLQGKRLYDRDAYANSVILEGVTGVEEEFVVRRVIAAPESDDYLLGEVLFFAPRWTARAVYALRSLTVLSESVLHKVQGIADDLAKEDWVPLEAYQRDAKALLELYRLGVLRLRVRKGEREIRLSGAPQPF
jgi:hypothetical protein